MIFLDSDVVIDLLREYPAAITWFDSLDDNETLALSGFVVMELIEGCQNKRQQEKLQGNLTLYEIVWLSSEDCDKALEIFAQYHLSHNAGLIDVLIGQTAVALGVSLYTFNQKHYGFIPNLQTIQPYKKLS